MLEAIKSGAASADEGTYIAVWAGKFIEEHLDNDMERRYGTKGKELAEELIRPVTKQLQ